LHTVTVGVSFENLTTYGKGIGASYFVSPGILFSKLFHRRPKSKAPRPSPSNGDEDDGVSGKKRKKKSTPTRKLIDGFSGVVQPGEMCLVLGRPGSGCTTFLRTISGYDEGFDKVEGDVKFGNFGMKEMKRFYRGEVAFNGKSGDGSAVGGGFYHRRGLITVPLFFFSAQQRRRISTSPLSPSNRLWNSQSHAARHEQTSDNQVKVETSSSRLSWRCSVRCLDWPGCLIQRSATT
jgi:hypothetical protein